MHSPLSVRIEATDLPGRACGPGPDAPGGHHDLAVGVQRRAVPTEWLGLTPGDAPSASWVLECTIDDVGDIRGPWVQGPRGGRFVYLSWVHGLDRVMFRRAKISLEGLDHPVVAAAHTSGVLTCRLGLTDDRGNPRCASLKSPPIAWSAG